MDCSELRRTPHFVSLRNADDTGPWRPFSVRGCCAMNTLGEMAMGDHPVTTTSQPTTSQEWASWLEAEEERSLQLYISYPERLVSDSNQERQVAGDYAG